MIFKVIFCTFQALIGAATWAVPDLNEVTNHDKNYFYKFSSYHLLQMHAFTFLYARYFHNNLRPEKLACHEPLTFDDHERNIHHKNELHKNGKQVDKILLSIHNAYQLQYNMRVYIELLL